MPAISVKGLIECGVHFGHRVSRWNPKMAPFIYGKRNLIHIINLRETIRGVIRASHFLGKVAGHGEQILFIGTKRQAKSVVESEAKKCQMPYVCERWLGGTLTNYSVIRQRLQRLEMLEAMEQDGSMDLLNKKEISRLMREKKKLLRNLDGIRALDRLPGAVVIIDPKREMNALREAKRLRIPVVAVMDTDCDPDNVDICIPGNDDAIRSIQSLVTHFTQAVAEGGRAFREYRAVEEKKRADEREREKAARVKKVDFRGDKIQRVETSDGRKGRSGGTGSAPPRKPRVAPKVKVPEKPPAEESPSAPVQREAAPPPEKVKTDAAPPVEPRVDPAPVQSSPVEGKRDAPPPSPGEGEASSPIETAPPGEVESPEKKTEET